MKDKYSQRATRYAEGECQWCGREGSDGHHLFRRSSAPNLIDDKNNIITLCRQCHDYATKNKDFENILQRVFFLQPDPELSVGGISKVMMDQSIIAPRDIARFRSWLAAEYAFVNDELIGLEMMEPKEWEAIRSREEVKSDTRATKILAMSELGLAMNRRKKYLRSLEKLMSALKGLIERLNNEAYNSY
jgi:hypothetical protein